MYAAQRAELLRGVKNRKSITPNIQTERMLNFLYEVNGRMLVSVETPTNWIQSDKMFILGRC